MTRKLPILSLWALSLFYSFGVSAQSQFIRFVPGPGEWQGELQTSITTYENASGVALELVAAIHIGDPDYYQALNNYFSSRDAVLYELVANPEDRPTPGNNGSSVSFLQLALANFLDVGFQLDQIDYSPPNFRHADLSPAQLQEIMASKNENFFSMFLSMALAQLASEQAALAEGAEPSSFTLVAVMNALLAEDQTVAFKYLFAEELGRSDGIMVGPALEQQLTLLGDRNRVALQVLKETLEDDSIRNISLFYGAAHMRGIERELLGAMGFARVGQRWQTAWQIP